jgi:hypothetical protein
LRILLLEAPRLAVTVYVADTDDFAARLDRALARNHPKVIDAQPMNDARCLGKE